MTATATVSKDELMSCRSPCRTRLGSGLGSVCLALVVSAFAFFASFQAGLLHASEAEPMSAEFKVCKQCHQIGRGAENRIGPHLNDIFGRVAGSLSDFRYSRSMREAGEAGLVWDRESLDSFLESPRKLVPRTRMTMSGIQDEEQRARLLELLGGFSENDPDLPDAEPTLTPEQYGLDPGLLAVEGNLEYGAYLAGECTTCHLPEGTDETIPSIEGWPTDEFVITLHAYKIGQREHPVMQMVTGRLSNEEIASLALYFRDIVESP